MTQPANIVPPMLARPAEQMPAPAPPTLAPPIEGALPDAAPQDLTAAFKSGQLTFQPGQRVGVKGPDGKIGTIPAESASDAVNAGG